MKKATRFSLFKKCVFAAMLVTAALPALAQTGVKIAATAGTAHPSAMLDVESTSKGVLVPRMTAAQRGAIGSPAEGLMVYQTDAPAGYWYFNGSVWIQMGVGAISGSGTTNYVPKWNTASSLSNSSLYDNGNVGIGTTGPADKLHVNGSIRAENGVYNAGGDHIEFMSGVRADDNSYEWLGFYSGSTRQGIILYDGAWSGANSLTNEFSLSAEGSNLLTLNTQANHIALMPKGGNVGIGTTAPAVRFHVTGGGMVLGTPSSGTNSATRTLTILQDGQSQISFGSYPGNWTSALQIQSNDNARYIWLSPISNGGNARLVSMGSDFDIMPGNTTTATFTTAGNVGIGTTTPGYRLHVPSGYIGTDYINTTDNVVTSGVTGIMVKAGDNYHRTATAAAIQAFIGSSGADNLGNHTATTYLQMGNQWINFNAGAGLYSSSAGNYLFPYDANYWYMRSNAGMQLYNNAATRMGYLYHDNGASFGLLPNNGAWRLRVDNSNVETYGGLYTSTAYVPFMYDRDNTGYYIDPAGTSQTSTIYNNSWFRAQGQSGFYFQDYGGGWYMLDGTWIRSYNSKYVYIDQIMRADGGVFANDAVRMKASAAGEYGSAPNSNFGLSGITLEQGLSESGGFHADGDNANAWSPGDGDRLFRVHDEDAMGTEAASERWYINGSGSAFTVSDINKKQNITPISGALPKLLSVSGYTYEYKKTEEEISKGDFPRPTAGVIAQEIEKVMPELVQTDEEGNKFLNYDGMTPYIIEGIKEQQEQIESMKETASDFGSVAVTAAETWVNFNAAFSENILNNTLPVVTLTSNQPEVTIHISEKSSKGFRIKITSAIPSGLVIDYIAMVHKNKAVQQQEPDAKYLSELGTRKTMSQWDERQIKAYKEHQAKSAAEIKQKLEKSEKAMALPANFVKPEDSGAAYEKEHAEKVRMAEEAKKLYLAVPEDAPAKSGTLADPNAPAPQLPTSPK